jgi:anti-anti-sigma factor
MATQLFNVLTDGSDVVIVDLQSSISSFDDSEVLAELNTLLARLQEPGVKCLIVDFEQVPYFGSSMLEALRTLWKHIHDEHGKLILCNLSEVGREIIEISKFDTLWPICNTRADALKLAREET